MTPKTIKQPFERYVSYTQEHWKLLRDKRSHTLGLLKTLNDIPSQWFVYGSVARGDVHTSSDIDIISFRIIRSYKLEYLILDSYPTILERKIVIATPNSLPKYQLSLPQDTTITIPLVEPSPRELEFYKFGGTADLSQLENQARVPGVNKQLVFIQPTELGHIEKSLTTIPTEAIQDQGISQSIIEERKRVLQRRDRVGRTGLFVEQQVPFGVSVEEGFKNLTDTNTLVKKNLKRRQ